MSEAAPDPDVAMLSRLAEIGMAAVERVHGQLMAAEDNAELNDLARSQARLTRCVRQTLLLKRKLAREAAQEAERRAKGQVPPDPPFERMGELFEAMTRVATAVGHDSDEALHTLYERIETEACDWTEHEDFADADLDAQVRWLCRELGYPPHLAETWRDLPLRTQVEPPWGCPEEESEPGPPPSSEPLHRSSA